MADSVVCVKCFGPEQIYNCAATADRPISEGELQMFCVSRLARDYTHRGCGVERSVTQCDGRTIIYAYESETALPDGAATQDAIALAGSEQGHKTDEPATLGEFTEDAIQSSKSSVKQAGEKIGDAARSAGEATVNSVQDAGKAIGNATRRTLKCLGSALNNC